MLKQGILVVMLCVAPLGYAMNCNKWEYAKLKDASKKELSDLYCASATHAIFNSKKAARRKDSMSEATERGSLGQATKFNNEAYDAGMAQAGCMEQLEDAESMLLKKFKAKPPKDCRAEYEREIISKMK